MEILRVTNLTVKSEKTILKNISFSLELGKVLGIIGESGSGKTTLSKILLGLYDKKQLAVTGNILFNRIDLLNLKNKEKGYHEIYSIFFLHWFSRLDDNFITSSYESVSALF